MEGLLKGTRCRGKGAEEGTLEPPSLAGCTLVAGGRGRMEQRLAWKQKRDGEQCPIDTERDLLGDKNLAGNGELAPARQAGPLPWE